MKQEVIDFEICGNTALPTSRCPVDGPIWKEVTPTRWERYDNAVVVYDRDVEGSTSKPWLHGHRAWKAFGPGPLTENFLHYMRSSRMRSSTKVARKWKEAGSAMRAVDKEYPPKA